MKEKIYAIIIILLYSLVLFFVIKDARAETAMIWHGYNNAEIIYFDKRDFGGDSYYDSAMIYEQQKALNEMKNQAYEMEKLRKRMENEINNSEDE